MSRPGMAKVLDPAVASLLLAGEETLPSVPVSLNHLHSCVGALVKAAADALDDDDEDEAIISDPEESLAQEERLEQRLRLLKRKEGLSSDRTLKSAFKLMDCLIGQYKLNRTDEILAEVEAVCQQRGGDWKIKYIQSTAFVRWKQYKFKEALKLFLEQQEIVGASAALCENIGHTYSSLGDLPKAEEYFERAIELLKRGSYGNRGGIYMGLGLVRDRLGKTREALPILEQALDHYQKEHTKDHVQLDSSIIAKAHMSVGKAHEKLGEKAKAAEHMADALAIFRRTVGYDSPLTANAMGALGKVKCELGKLKEVRGGVWGRMPLCSCCCSLRLLCPPLEAAATRLGRGSACSLLSRSLLAALSLTALSLTLRLAPFAGAHAPQGRSEARDPEGRLPPRDGLGAALAAQGPSHGRGQGAAGDGRLQRWLAARRPPRHLRPVRAARRARPPTADPAARNGRARHARRLLQDVGRDVHARAGLRGRRGALQRGAPLLPQGACGFVCGFVCGSVCSRAASNGSAPATELPLTATGCHGLQVRDFDCSGLIEGCDMLLSIAKSNKPKALPKAAAASVPSGGGGGSGGGGSSSGAGPSS